MAATQESLNNGCSGLIIVEMEMYGIGPSNWDLICKYCTLILFLNKIIYRVIKYLSLFYTAITKYLSKYFTEKRFIWLLILVGKNSN
jgi:hypothetical protein